jgi:hypothetical protein
MHYSPLQPTPAAASGPNRYTPSTTLYALTAERRRAVCVHEAAHAILHALGGAWVYRVAVAPEGATEWQTTGRKGEALSDLWGLCSPADCPGQWFVRWDPDECQVSADRKRFGDLLAMMEANRRGSKREQWRQIRAHVCAVLAGPAAEQMHEGEADPYLDEGEGGAFDDITKAQVYAWLLPWRAEIDHLAAVTVQALRQPEVWALVLRLADELQRVGDLEDEALLPFLPAQAAVDWPPSPRAKTCPPLIVKPGFQQ